MSGKQTPMQRLLKEYSGNPHRLNQLVFTAFSHNNGLRWDGSPLSGFIVSSFWTETEMELAKQVNTLEDVISIFEQAIPKENTVANGAVYTPKYIREHIVEHSFSALDKNAQDVSVADISCGCGAFLITAADYLVANYGYTYERAYSNIWGIDVDGDSIARAQLLISLHAAKHGESVNPATLNLHHANTLDFDFGSQRFDIIVGNPPYVRSKNIDPLSKELMKSFDVCKCGNSDLYIPFFQIGLSILKDGGTLGFIAINSFLKSVNARELRRLMATGHYGITIINFGEELVFKGRLAYTCLFFAQKRTSDHLDYAKARPVEIRDKHTLEFSHVELGGLNHFKGWNLNRSDIMDAVNRIETTGVPLGKAYSIKNGIATLANGIFIFSPEKDDGRYYHMRTGGNDIRLIEKDACRDIVKPNILKTEEDLGKRTEKLIFPYDAKGDLISETDFKAAYPQAYEYLHSHKDILQRRDKGRGDYPWYAFGRTQAINDKGIKLLFPYMTDTPHFVYTADEDTLIYCGYAIFGATEKELRTLKRILESDVFAFYMKNTAKPYATGYYSYAKNYVKGFGIPKLTDSEERALAEMKDQWEVARFLCDKYGIDPAILKSY